MKNFAERIVERKDYGIASVKVEFSMLELRIIKDLLSPYVDNNEDNLPIEHPITLQTKMEMAITKVHNMFDKIHRLPTTEAVANDMFSAPEPLRADNEL